MSVGEILRLELLFCMMEMRIVPTEKTVSLMKLLLREELCLNMIQSRRVCKSPAQYYIISHLHPYPVYFLDLLLLKLGADADNNMASFSAAVSCPDNL